jgi:hypothetical protein
MRIAEHLLILRVSTDFICERGAYIASLQMLMGSLALRQTKDSPSPDGCTWATLPCAALLPPPACRPAAPSWQQKQICSWKLGHYVMQSCFLWQVLMGRLALRQAKDSPGPNGARW